MRKKQNTMSTSDNKGAITQVGQNAEKNVEKSVGTTVEDPVIEKLDAIIELLSSIKAKVDSISASVPKQFDFSRLVKD